ncbi:NAD(P)H-binding protein [Streptosporangium sp. CA-135522]|uniref:NAD(P)H-binding protein n=1 Tax=Streptosporangium sp. CA-135522 TaxID=3240072 RepID=UPI003D8AE685
MILVIGATGNVGRHVVPLLLESGAAVRALVRDPGNARLPEGVEAVRGDLTRPETVEAALDGVESVFLVWPGFAAEQAAPVVKLIAGHARRVVYLSAMAAADMFHGEVERLIRESGLEWTFLRPGGFAVNTLMWAGQIREGVVRWPYALAGRSLIHERDIAAVAALALTGDGHAGKAYDLTGPSVVTQAEQVRIIGEAIGRPARYEELPREAAREQLLAAWGEATFVDSALDYWASIVAEPEPVTRTVEELTGVPARTFHQWAADHADDFR